MNITPNYQLKAFNLRMDKPQVQTNPNFGMAEKIAAGAGKVIPATAALFAGTVLAVQNGKTEKSEHAVPNEIPTKEEFETMLNNRELDNYDKERWLEAYDIDAKNTVTFFNLEDKDGNKYYETADMPSKFSQGFLQHLQHPELVKQVVDTEDDNSVRIFSFPAANVIVETSAYYSAGLTKMLAMRDEYGNMRFSDPDDYSAAEVFEKYPAEAEKYAGLKDETGNYRFSGIEINEIVKAKMLNQEIIKDPDNCDGVYHNFVDKVNEIVRAIKEGKLKPEDIDNILNLKRNDGSFVFDRLPYFKNIKLYAEDPDLFSEICNIRTPNRYKWVYTDYMPQLIDLYKRYPQETKHLLQMAGKNENESRFSDYDILHNPEATRMYKYAPKTFRSLAQLKKGDYGNDGYRFSLSEICQIITEFGRDEKYNISELSKDDLKTVADLSKISVQQRHNQSYFSINMLFNVFSTYKKYPKEFKEIMSLLEKTNKCNGNIPEEEDILLYKNNRAEFIKKYIM